jgi:hypothetical protein
MADEFVAPGASKADAEMDSVETHPIQVLRYKLLMQGIDPDAEVAPGATALDSALESSGADPSVEARYNELVENATLSEAALIGGSRIDDLNQEIGGLIGRIRASQEQIQKIANAPQLLPVPQDVGVNLIRRLGVALESVGGDSSTLQPLFEEKQTAADEQRSSIIEQMAADQQIENLFQSELISKLRGDVDRLSSLEASKTEAMDADGLVGQEREDAQFGADLGLVKTGAMTAKELWSSASNRAAAMRAGVSLDEVIGQENTTPAVGEQDTSALSTSEAKTLAFADELSNFIFGA